MAICENTIFDLLRNSYLIPYRFNADGIENPVILQSEVGVGTEIIVTIKKIKMRNNIC